MWRPPVVVASWLFVLAARSSGARYLPCASGPMPAQLHDFIDCLHEVAKPLAKRKIVSRELLARTCNLLPSLRSSAMGGKTDVPIISVDGNCDPSRTRHTHARRVIGNRLLDYSAASASAYAPLRSTRSLAKRDGSNLDPGKPLRHVVGADRKVWTQNPHPHNEWNSPNPSRSRENKCKK